jgi:hypothetical protein
LIHCMTDCETFGVRPGCVIRSIGAVMFDLNGALGATFYANVSRASCEAAGLHIDPQTEKWWSDQSAEARAALEPDQMALPQVLTGFFRWFADQRAEKIWSHGATFDIPIIEAAAHAVKLRAPWKFWNARDTRTLYEVCDFDVRDMRRPSGHHEALGDAKFQVACVAAALQKLSRKYSTEPRASVKFDSLVTPKGFFE